MLDYRTGASTSPPPCGRWSRAAPVLAQAQIVRLPMTRPKIDTPDCAFR